MGIRLSDQLSLLGLMRVENTAHPGCEAGELDQHEDVGGGQVDKGEEGLRILR